MAGARPRLLLGLAAILLAVACGGGEAQPGAPAEDWGWAPKEYVALELPLAEHVRWDDEAQRPLVVNLLPSGDIKFEGNVWPLATGVPEGRAASLEALRRALAEATSAAGTARLPLMLHADRTCRWVHVAAVLHQALEPPLRIDRLFWAVRTAATHYDVRQEATIEATPSPWSRPLIIELAGRRLDDSLLEVRLSIGDWVRTAQHDHWTWIPEDGPDPWQGAAAVLAETAPRHDGVELRFTGEERGVEWRHVVRILDLLLGAGVREVDPPGLGIRLVLAEPEDPRTIGRSYPDDPVASPFGVVLAVVAALLAFAITFAGAARSRRVRPRRSRSP